MKESHDLDVMLGDPKKAVLAMTLPLILSYAVAQVNTYADSAWCAAINSDASTALASVIPYYWIIVGIGTGLGIGAAAVIARHLARGEKDEAESAILQTMILSVLASIIALPLGLLSLEPLLAAYNMGSISDSCRAYIVPMIACSFVFILNGTVTGLLRAEGAGRRSMIVLLIAAVLNIILDPVLMFGADMGIAGASAATIISTAISTIIGLYWFVSGKTYMSIRFRGIGVRKDQMSSILSVAIPRITELFFVSFLSIMQRIVMVPNLGSIAIPMYYVPWTYVTLVMVIAQAAGSAIVPVCSSALGVKNVEKSDAAFKYIFKVSMISMFILAAIIFIFADYFVIPLSTDASLAQYRDTYAYGLRVYMLCIPFLGLLELGGGYLQAMMKSKIPMATAFIRNIVLLVLLMYSTTMEQAYWSVLIIEILGGAMNIFFARAMIRVYRQNYPPVDRAC